MQYKFMLRLVRMGQTLIERRGLFETFYVTDLRRLKTLYDQWRDALPRVYPYYAVKCNPDRAILRTLSALGCNFDCASPAEIETILSLGVSPGRILFANPAKRPGDIRYAANAGVATTTFDSVCELEKLAEFYPKGEAYLRFCVDNPHARCPLGKKYGATEDEVPELLDAARRLNVPVTGVAFHIGSGTDPGALGPLMDVAFSIAKRIMVKAKEAGFDMRVVDIGGGYHPCNLGVVREALDRHFDSDAPTFIAEPGRYFAESVVSIYAPVYHKRVRDGHPELWITEGVYGAFNCIDRDHQRPTYLPFRTSGDPFSAPVATRLWGPTCDSYDLIDGNAQLPGNMRVGDWLVFPNAGAYTLAGACDFNGIKFTRPKRFVVRSEERPAISLDTPLSS